MPVFSWCALLFTFKLFYWGGGSKVRRCVIGTFGTCLVLRLTHFYFSLLRQTLLSFVMGVPYRFSRLLIRYLAMLWSFVIPNLSVPPLVIRFRTCSLSGCVVVDGDLSYASQTGRSTTDIQSNGWIKYQQVHQKRKQINMSGRVLVL